MEHHQGKTSAIILAAGKGTRMKSDTPKVLHDFHGHTFLEYAVGAASSACDEVIVVVGYAADRVAAYVPSTCKTVLQKEQRGTGHAVACAVAKGVEGDWVIVLPCDHPLLTDRTVSALAGAAYDSRAVVTLLTVSVPNFEGVYEQFRGCGRIRRDNSGKIMGIVEFRDASDDERRLTEVNVSCYCFDGAWLKSNIENIAAGNSAGEYYLTDMIALAVGQGLEIRGYALDDWREAIGVNTVEHLEFAERIAV